MTQFFADNSQIDRQANRVIITGDDYNHMKNVLRIRPGEEFSVRCPGEPAEYRCSVIEYTSSDAVCEIRFIKEDDTELPVSVTIYQGLPKADKFETVIQKCVELGACRVVPVRTARSIVKLDDKKAESKCARWNQIAEGAAKQSQRGIIPSVGPVMDFDEALEDSKDFEMKLIPYELAGDMASTRELMGRIKPGDRIGIFIGPEGGFESSEVDKASQAGFIPITLGRRILRTETAAMTVMSWLVYLME